MPWTIPQMLVASCGNAMAADDAFGPLVADRVREMSLADVEVIDLGMQPCGLLHRLEHRLGVIVVDAARASAEVPAGTLLDEEFPATSRLQLVHDIALSSHGLSIAHELALAKKMDILPPLVRVVAATVRDVALGRPLTTATRRLVEPAALRVASIVCQWQVEARNHGHA